MTPHANAVSLLLLYAVLGALVGVAAAGFVRGLHLVEDVFDRIPWRYARHMLGMLLVGVLMYALFRSASANTTSTASATHDRRASSSADTTAAWLLGLLFVCKLLATSTQPRLGLVGRHLFALAVHGRDARRRLRLAAR